MLRLFARSRRFRVGLIEAREKDQRSYGIPLSFGYLVSEVRRIWPREVDMFVAETPEELLAREPHLVGVTSVTSTFRGAEGIAEAVKRELDVPVVVGGQHVTPMWSSLPKSMDVAVMGEGDVTFPELVALAMAGQLDPHHLARIPGIAYHHGDTVKRTGPRQQVANLDVLPFPARAPNPLSPHEATIMTSRGCPFDCTFCSSSRYWAGFRAFSASYVLEEMAHICRTVRGVRSIYILDDLFVASRKRLKQIVQGVVDRRLNRRVTFQGFVRANLVDDELCELLEAMNMTVVRFGAESASDRILKQIKAGSVTAAQNQRAVDLLHRHGLSPRAAFMVGVPGETEEDLRLTLDFIKRNEGKLLVRGFYLTVPFPGTPLWDGALAQGLVSTDMDWSLLNLDFKSPDFDWDGFLYLNEAALPRERFLSALRESGLVEAPS